MNLIFILLFALLSCDKKEPPKPVDQPKVEVEVSSPGKLVRTDSWGWVSPDDTKFPVVAFCDPLLGKEKIKQVKDSGSFVIGYLSIGSVEKNRDDYDQLKPYAPKKMNGWDEYWLDLNQMDKILPLMKKRIDEIKELGLEGFYTDNLDVHANYDKVPQAINEAYALEIVKYAREVGLTYIGFNNGLLMLKNIGKHADFFINESCNKYDECHYYEDAVKEGKPIFHLEYSSRYCKPVEGHSVRYFEENSLTAKSSVCL